MTDKITSSKDVGVLKGEKAKAFDPNNQPGFPNDKEEVATYTDSEGKEISFEEYDKRRIEGTL